MKSVKYTINTLVILFLLVACKSSAPTSANVEDGRIISTDEQLLSPWHLYNGSQKRYWDLLHTELFLSFDWQKETVIGKAVLHVKPYFYDQQWITIDAKAMKINSVKNADSSLPLQYEYDNYYLIVDLSELVLRDRTVRIEVEYEALTDKNYLENIRADEKGLYFVGPSEFYPDVPKQIWTQGETFFNSHWFPTLDQPNERCTSEIYLTVDNDYKTLSNGRLVSSTINDSLRTDYWKMELPHAPYLFAVVVGDFVKVEEKNSKIPLSYWTEPAYEDDIGKVFGNTKEMIEFYSETFGVPYPWPEYNQVVVREFVTGAMENTTAVIYNDQLNMDSRDLIDYHWDDIISHELTHQWFGDLVTCESWANLPLNESFATYGEYLWFDYKYGRDEADYHLYSDYQSYLSEAEEKNVDLIRFGYEDPNDMFDRHSYQKGGLILHHLRKYVGDDAFFMSIKEYLTKNKFSAVEIHDLRLAFEKVTGEDLNWFFTQWFFNAGHPKLEVRHYTLNDSLYINIEQVQDLQQYPVYRLPLYVEVWFPNEETLEIPIVVEDQKHEFVLPVREQPMSILVDAEFSLPGEVSHFRTIDEWLVQLKRSNHVRARLEALSHLLASSSKDESIVLGLRDSSPRVRDYVLTEMDRDNAEVDLILPRVEDSVSYVRASALTLMDEIKYNSDEVFLNALLYDSSSMVLGVALDYFLAGNHELSDSLFKSYKDRSNINITLPIAHYINQFLEREHLSWYLDQFPGLSSVNLYYMLGLFGEYIESAPRDQQMEAVAFLSYLAEKHQSNYVRLAAFQDLLFLLHIEGVVETIDRIKKNEKDKLLADLYQSYDP